MCAAGALRNLAVNADNNVAIASAGGIAPLVALARDGTEAQKEEAAAALAVLAVNDANKAAIAREAAAARPALLNLTWGGRQLTGSRTNSISGDTFFARDTLVSGPGTGRDTAVRCFGMTSSGS